MTSCRSHPPPTCCRMSTNTTTVEPCSNPYFVLHSHRIKPPPPLPSQHTPLTWHPFPRLPTFVSTRYHRLAADCDGVADAQTASFPPNKPVCILHGVVLRHCTSTSPCTLHKNPLVLLAGPWVYHYDLYRLHSQVDLQRLDLRESLKTGVSLIEWPACLGEMTPGDRLDVDIGLVQPVSTRQTPLLLPSPQIPSHNLRSASLC